MDSDLGDWSPGGNDGWGFGGNGGRSPDRNRGWSPDRYGGRQSEETGDHSNRSPHTSPARYESLWRLGLDPQQWSDQQASTSGTSDFERERLRESKMQAVRDWMEERGTWKVFENKLVGQLKEELATAEELGVKPVHVDDPDFFDVANGGTVNWVVTQRGDLLFSPQYVDGEAIAHTVLIHGKPVVAAGDALIVA